MHERFTQTLETIASIRTWIPNSFVVLIDNSRLEKADGLGRQRPVRAVVIGAFLLYRCFYKGGARATWNPFPGNSQDLCDVTC